MSGNLTEFLKVLTIVVTWSTLILTGRHYMLSFDGKEEDEDIEEDPEDTGMIKVPTSQISDTVDYDGMGNYGRFPEK